MNRKMFSFSSLLGYLAIIICLIVTSCEDKQELKPADVALKACGTCGSFPVCCNASSDPDGDGWGWEENKSCVINGSNAQKQQCGSVSGGATGFTISGNQLRDANNKNFIMKGINVPLSWFVNDVNNNIANIKNRTGANTLRIVVNTSTADNAWQTCVNNCINNKMIPMVELHDVTGGTDANRLNDMAKFWANKKSFLTSSNVARHILINIANEWGDWNMANAQQYKWRDAYKTAITTIRNAGINTTLVIDAPDWGQDLRNANTLMSYAKELQNHDPRHNLLFSVHMYCEWANGGGSSVSGGLPNIKNNGIPIIVGEFGYQHGNGNGGVCDINESQIINTCQSNGIGWLAWSWKGNSSDVAYLDLSTNWSGTSLTGWGNTVINGSNGTKTAVKASVFN